MFVQYAQRGLEKLRESKDVLIQVQFIFEFTHRITKICWFQLPLRLTVSFD